MIDQVRQNNNVRSVKHLRQQRREQLAAFQRREPCRQNAAFTRKLLNRIKLAQRTNMWINPNSPTFEDVHFYDGYSAGLLDTNSVWCDDLACMQSFFESNGLRDSSNEKEMNHILENNYAEEYAQYREGYFAGYKEMYPEMRV